MNESLPNWKLNKMDYIKRYSHEHYHRVTVQLSNVEDSDIWDAIKDADSKNNAVKTLLRLGLSVLKETREQFIRRI